MPPIRVPQFIAKRSESDMLAQAPIKLRLGNKEYEVPILSNKKAAAWREKLYAALGPLVAGFDFSNVDITANQQHVSHLMSQKLSQELIAYPQRLAELLFDFAPSLPKDDIMGEDPELCASDEQICLAFAQCAEVGYPFFFHLWATKRALSIAPQKTPTAAVVQ